jgi:hypothetical protein
MQSLLQCSLTTRRGQKHMTLARKHDFMVNVFLRETMGFSIWLCVEMLEARRKHLTPRLSLKLDPFSEASGLVPGL